jgi:3',5'-cyclic-nucleotide phosphodiesterase
VWDRWLTELQSKFGQTTFANVIEQALQECFHAETVVYWENVPSLEQLYSETRELATVYSRGLAGACYLSQSAMRVSSPTSHPAYFAPLDGKIARGDRDVYMFPVFGVGSEILSVVEIVKDLEFTENDIRFAGWFSEKCGFLHRWANVPREIDSLAMSLIVYEDEQGFRQKVFPRLKEDFACTGIEVWKFDENSLKFGRYLERGWEELRKEDRGIPSFAIEEGTVVNVANSRTSAAYQVTVDGSQDEAVLAVPCKLNWTVWCVVLRRPRPIFSLSDETRLKQLAPLIAKALTNAERVSSDGGEDIRSLRGELDSLRSLIDVLELISSQLDPAKLVGTIMDRGRGLTNADRCSIFLVNETKDRLVTYLQTGLHSAIDIPIDAGIAGKAVSERQCINIPDAYKSPFFDPRTDRDSGYHTKSLIAVPIFNNHGDILGCTEFINKGNGEAFNEWDVKLIQLFNVFCGISLENARLYQESKDMHQRMSGLLDTAFSLSKSEGIHQMLTDILQNAKALLGADRASVFTLEPGANQLTSLIVEGPKLPGTLPLDRGLAALAVKTKKAIVENNCYSNPDFNSSVDRESGYRTQSLIALPILDSGGTVLGVVELLNKASGQFSSSDVETVNAFTAFAAVALQNSRAKTVQQAAGPEAEMRQWIAPTERSMCDVPAALELTAAEKEMVLSMNCFSPDFKGIGHFKECFFFYKLFNFLELFKITASQFYIFLHEISSRYTGTSYHNWTHACDVTQCIVFMLHKGRLGEAYEAWELFTLCTAAICHDTNHQGFNNVYNVKAETPLGILFKDTSVMEMHHITQAIPVITMDNVALFRAFDPPEVKKVWALFIKIILSTDMARHFDLVKRAQAAVDEGSFDMSDDEFRLLGLQLIMKVGDISNVSRPFELADRWCDILNEEFFHQGDLEKESGIGLTSPLNDRETSNKPKSQIGFYNFICLPLYSVVAKLYTPLQVQVDQVKSNLEQWKALVAAQAAAAS